MRALVCLLGALVSLSGTPRAVRSAARAEGALAHDAYVWQRDWASGASEAVRAAAPDVARFAVLAAEIETRGARPRRIDVAYDRAALAAAARPVVLVIRIGPVAGADPTGAPAFALARAAAVDALARARAAGLAIAELQIDFDAGERQLGAFAAWLRELRPALGGAALSITGLPAWLDAPGVDDVVAAVDRWVLQVHVLARRGDGFALFDADEARVAVERAGTLGAPFQVALPTYAMRVGVLADGTIVDVVAEEAEPAWPAGTRTHDVRTPEAVLAAFVAAIERDRPAALTGVIWFRLAVPGDRRNLDLAAWRRLRHGLATPRPRAAALAAAPDGPGVFDLALTDGDADGDAPLPDAITVTWPAGARLAASDAHAGWQATPGATSVTFHRIAAHPSPRVGWLRVASAEEVHAQAFDVSSR